MLSRAAWRVGTPDAYQTIALGMGYPQMLSGFQFHAACEFWVFPVRAGDPCPLRRPPECSVWVGTSIFCSQSFFTHLKEEFDIF